MCPCIQVSKRLCSASRSLKGAREPQKDHKENQPAAILVQVHTVFGFFCCPDATGAADEAEEEEEEEEEVQGCPPALEVGEASVQADVEEASLWRQSFRNGLQQYN